jgi:hypothetical protein
MTRGKTETNEGITKIGMPNDLVRHPETGK